MKIIQKYQFAIIFSCMHWYFLILVWTRNLDPNYQNVNLCFFRSIPITVSSGLSILSSCAALCSWIALFLRTWNGSYPFFVPESQTLPGPKEFCVLEAESLLVEAKRYKVTLVHVAGSSVVVTWHLSLAVVVLLLSLPMFWCHPISHRTYLMLMQAAGQCYESFVCSLLVKDGGWSGCTAVMPWPFGGTPCCPLTLTQVPQWIGNDGERLYKARVK